MASISRITGVLRQVVAMRAYSYSAAAKEAAQVDKATARKQIEQIREMYKAHPHGSEAMWYGVTAMGVAICGALLFRDTFYPDHPIRPEYKAYPHNQIRSKRFPWGDGNHSLFHNPKACAVPGVGYEEEADHH